MNTDTSDRAGWVRDLVQDFISTSPLNTLEDEVMGPAWEEALVGFASGDDPLWIQYKEYVGAFHWTPWEVFTQHHPGEPTRPEELTVISWILPQRASVRKANRKSKRYPSPEWARNRVYGEKFNEALRQHITDCLQHAGYSAISPMLSPSWTRVVSQRFSYASSWSERHAAHACGLGTFGLSDGLITPRGKAMRVGSVVSKIAIPPTPRPYSTHQAYCLFFSQGTCGKCIDRCPARAITEAGHDKVKCRQHLLKGKEFVKEKYGFDGYGCGLCQVGVPCESQIPAGTDPEGDKG